MTTPQQRLNHLRKNAPAVYSTFVSQRKHTIEDRIEELRMKYSMATELEKERMTQEANTLKDELALYE